MIAISSKGGGNPPRFTGTDSNCEVDICIKGVNKESAGYKLRKYVLAHGIDPLELYALVQVESNWKPNAIGADDERGLGQLKVGTAAEVGLAEDDILDPIENIKGTVRNLKRCKDKYGKEYLRCHNGGIGWKFIKDPARKEIVAKNTLIYQGKIKTLVNLLKQSS